MSSLRRLPFEKNRYYGGKMLTSADFSAEQSYVDGKQMFLNAVTWGFGILRGLGVKQLDDHSFLVDNGAAVDGSGRLIVAEKSCVKSISAMKGSDRLTGERAVLYLSYAEEEVQEVRAVVPHDGQGEYQKNRIQEKYELYVADWKEREEKEAGKDFFSEAAVVMNQDYAVSLSIPVYVCRQSAVRLSLRIRKLTDAEVPFEFCGVLQLPAFMTEEGKKELDIGCPKLCLKKGESYRRDYWLLPDHGDIRETEIFLKPGTVRALAGDEACSFRKKARLHVTVTEESPEMLAQRRAGKNNLDTVLDRSQTDVPLALLELEESEGVRRITRIQESGVRRYIPLPCQAEEREKYRSCYRDLQSVPVSLRQEQESPEKSGEMNQCDEKREPLIRGGVIEIPLDVKMKKGKVCYSEEIVHGLGPGNVYVDVGLLCGDGTAVYGDNSLFARPGIDTSVRTAVKVFYEKGSFQVAVRVSGEQNDIILPLQWAAVRMAGHGEGQMEDISAMSITLENSTVYLRPREKYYLEVQFHNMAPCTLLYEPTDGEGSVSPDGTYTAPAKEGVYEVRISCRDYPKICTYVYAVVGNSYGSHL